MSLPLLRKVGNVGKVKDVYDDIIAAVRRAVASRERKTQFSPCCIGGICLSCAATAFIHSLYDIYCIDDLLRDVFRVSALATGHST
mmetsp:Transcript_15781/g.26380  ORF Transcript_15781/g.26380 Transcript_15781/m.26380 type:complete len:86 (-) Transcript_15781:1217-1474(-)